MKRKSNDKAKVDRSRATHQANGNVQPDLAALIKERDELRKRVAELRQDKRDLLTSLGASLSKPIKINKREMLKQARSRPTMQELIAELKKLGN